MIKNIKHLNDFAIEKGLGHVVELPLVVKADDILDTLEKRYHEYVDLINLFVYEKQGRTDDMTVILSDMELLHNSIISIIKDSNNTYSLLTDALNTIQKKYCLFDFIKKQLENKVLFRFCSYSELLSKPIEFYHCPTTKQGIDTRFGKSDNYLWYLGFSDEVCKYEARGRTGSMATFIKKDYTEPLYVFDLTQDGLFIEDNKEFNKICYIFWWILLCCYCVSLDEKNDSYTYCFPQLLSQYLKDTYPDISGIKYYTVRNAKLNPDECAFVNVALFTREYDENGYDSKLCGKFRMIESEQNVKTDVI